MKHMAIGILLLLATVCTDAGNTAYPSASLYNLEAALIDQSGKTRTLDMHRGAPVLVTMFYGSCPMACPLLIDTIKATERALPEQERKRLRVLMISIDPQHDTPDALARLASARHLDGARWTLARTDARAVRRIAAALNIQYRELPNGGFNHTSVISLLDAQGTIREQQSTSGSADATLLTTLRELARD